MSACCNVCFKLSSVSIRLAAIHGEKNIQFFSTAILTSSYANLNIRHYLNDDLVQEGGLTYDYGPLQREGVSKMAKKSKDVIYERSLVETIPENIKKDTLYNDIVKLTRSLNITLLVDNFVGMLIKYILT